MGSLGKLSSEVDQSCPKSECIIYIHLNWTICGKFLNFQWSIFIHIDGGIFHRNLIYSLSRSQLIQRLIRYACKCITLSNFNHLINRFERQKCDVDTCIYSIYMWVCFQNKTTQKIISYVSSWWITRRLFHCLTRKIDMVYTFNAWIFVIHSS